MDILGVSKEEKYKLMSDHPVVTKDYLIITPVIKKAYWIIRDKVWMRSPGIFMHATPRMGKSTCVAAVSLLLQSEFPNVFILTFSAISRGTDPTAMFREMFYWQKMHIEKSGSLRVLTPKIQTHIEANVAMKGGKQFVLIIDEMQRLNEDDLRLLHAIQNRLTQSGIRMTTLGFAQPDILHLVSALKLTKSNELIGRFLSEEIAFDGCAAKEDLEAILDAYDSELFYPDESAISYTDFFLPQAFENGFRLKTYSSQIWSQLKMLSEPLQTGSIPMEHLTRTIEYLLLSANKDDYPSLKLTDEDVLNAANSSNLKYFVQATR